MSPKRKTLKPQNKWSPRRNFNKKAYYLASGATTKKKQLANSKRIKSKGFKVRNVTSKKPKSRIGEAKRFRFATYSSAG